MWHILLLDREQDRKLKGWSNFIKNISSYKEEEGLTHGPKCYQEEVAVFYTS